MCVKCKSHLNGAYIDAFSTKPLRTFKSKGICFSSKYSVIKALPISASYVISFRFILFLMFILGRSFYCITFVIFRGQLYSHLSMVVEPDSNSIYKAMQYLLIHVYVVSRTQCSSLSIAPRNLRKAMVVLVVGAVITGGANFQRNANGLLKL